MGRDIACRRTRGSILTTLLVAAAQGVTTACGDDPTTPPASVPREPTVVIVSGDAQTAEVGTRLPNPLVVRVSDSLGTPAAGVVVRFSSSYTATEDSTTTDTRGVAAVSWTLGTRAATQEIVARARVYANSQNGSVTTEFSARATAGPPVAVIALGGHGAVAAPGALVDTVVMVATDRFDNRSSGAPAVWAVTAGGGTVQPLGTATDTGGIARALWTLGSAEGEHTLDVTVGSVTRRLNATASVALPAMQVVVGTSHSCALVRSGAVYCWGANSGGQIGSGQIDARIYATPVRVGGGMSFASLTAGSAHTCGLTAAGEAYCWGYGRSGQLGLGFLGTIATPARVEAYNFSALAAGIDHTCGLTTARTIACWGDNHLGQLGFGTGLPGGVATRPVYVGAPGIGAFTGIAAGANSTCALALNGEVYCWGSNAKRELGGDVPGRCFVMITTQFVYDGTETMPCSSAPVRLNTPAVFRSLSAGGSGWCGVTAGELLMCWGNMLVAPQAVATTIEKGWVVGNDVCGLNVFGAVGCWGLWRSSVVTVVQPFGTEVDLGDLASGLAHWCGVSRDARRFVYCWGSNFSGQLGDGTTTDRALPVAVLAPRIQ